MEAVLERIQEEVSRIIPESVTGRMPGGVLEEYREVVYWPIGESRKKFFKKSWSSRNNYLRNPGGSYWRNPKSYSLKNPGCSSWKNFLEKIPGEVPGSISCICILERITEEILQLTPEGTAHGINVGVVVESRKTCLKNLGRISWNHPRKNFWRKPGWNCWKKTSRTNNGRHP